MVGALTALSRLPSRRTVDSGDGGNARGGGIMREKGTWGRGQWGRGDVEKSPRGTAWGWAGG